MRKNKPLKRIIFSRLQHLFYSITLLAAALLTSDGVLARTETTRTVKVGVYENAPKIFLASDTGKISGILGDLLTAIAFKEGWQLQPVPCLWHACLTLLEKGELDLMPDVALIDERRERFSFHQEAALISWSNLYTTDEQHFNSFLETERSVIAVLEGSVQQLYLKRVAESFQLSIGWLPVEKITDGFEAVVSGKATAIATNRFTGDINALKYHLHATPIVFHPVKLFFAAPKNHNLDLLKNIDHYLKEWKQNTGSIYHQILEKWLNQGLETVAPAYVPYLISALALLVILAGIASYFLRKEVSEKRRQIEDNQLYLNTLLNNINAQIYVKDCELNYRYANKEFCRSLKLSSDEINWQRDTTLYENNCAHALEQEDMRVIADDQQSTLEEIRLPRYDSEQTATYLTIRQPLKNSKGEIYGVCGIATDVTKHRQTEQQLHTLSFYDPLTKLPNRALVLDRLEQALLSHEQTGFHGALLLMDIEGFRTLNATLGQDTGDKLLKFLGNFLKNDLQGSNTVGRLNGDEFLIVMEDIDQEQEQAVRKVISYIESLAQRLSDTDSKVAATPINIQIRVGIGMFADVQGPANALLRATYVALTKAKSSPNQIFAFFNSQLQQEINEHLSFESRLKQAPVNNSLQLYVQPQVDGNSQIIGMEGLLRWNDSALGMVSPGKFIPIAEESSLIIKLGEWVIETACSYLKDWADIPELQALTLSINISPRHFRHPDFIKHIQHCLDQTSINPAHLKLEITESLLIDDIEGSVAIMNRLREMGIRFALDDFGTGYASLAYLKKLPLEQLKIDQSFVQDILVDSNDAAIVHAILSLGDALNMEIIAEGVETSEQAKSLAEKGCTLFQGYFYGRPGPVSIWTKKILEDDQAPTGQNRQKSSTN